MKSLPEFLSQLSNLDIRLWLDEERLRCNAPKEALTPDLQTEITQRKPEIIQFLKQINFASHLTLEPIKPIPRDKNLPLSFGQQGLWFIDQLEDSSTANYHQLFAVHLQGSINLAVLEQALIEIVRRHEILRTTFKTVDGQAFQAIAPDANLTLTIVDLQRSPKSKQWQELQQLALTKSQQPFNLAQGPLLRVTLFQLAATDNVLLFSIHHAIADGWSGTIMIEELTAIYQAFAIGKPSPLPELPIQYADFAYWQHQRLHESLQAQLSYWERKLGGTLPILQLPSDRPRPAVQTFQGATITLELDADLTVKLKQLSQQSGVTLFMTLLAAFNTLLFRYTNQEDICVGTTIANRHSRDLESLIGYFLNTVVIRTDLTENPSFRELLQRVRDLAWEAYTYQDLPFDQLVAKLQPKRDLSYTPLFQVMFVLENAPKQKMQLPGLTLSYLEMPMATANFDLSLSMRETEQGLLAKFEYNTDLFDAATISRMAGNFQTLLWAIATNPQQPILELPLLTETERHQLLEEWNDTQTEYPQKCIHQLFEAQVERTPEAVAVIFEDKQLTYQELNAQANQLAQYLQTLGVGKEVLVGICVERSLEMIVGLLGILKAGGAYVPLDPAYPEERLTFMLSDTQVSVLITQQRLINTLPVCNAYLVCLDKDWSEISQNSQENLLNKTTSKSLAYIIYTSGSTGKSKGVMISHGSLVNAYQGWENAYQLKLLNSHLQMASFSFDVFSGDLIRALCSGARLVLCSREWLLEPEKLYQLMQQEKIKSAEFSPAVLRNLIEYLDRTQQNLHFMRLLIVGSDTLYVQEFVEIKRFCSPETRLINSYGVSEATIDSTYFESTLVSLPINGIVPIGRPFANTQIYILNRHLQAVPIGVTGELYIAGVGLARGYLNRPDLTEQKFIPNPFSNEPGTRLYKTGDLVRYLPDGNIEFLGRIDHQVKIRGFRIEIGEIEAILNQHSQVRETAVIVREDPPNNKRLVAYIVARNEQVSTNELRRFLKEKLPDFMVPGVFVNLEALPLTPNGKIDRRALPTPDTSSLTPETSFVPPRNTLELQLAQIWSEILGVHSVGIRDNFFELGGDSIIAIQIIARANQAGIKLTTKQLFQHQTIIELASVAVLKQAIQTEQGIVTGLVSLTPIQHWFFEQNFLDPHHWNQTFTLEVSQVLDLDLLEQALQQLLLHHDALRLRFEQQQSGWEQFLVDYDTPVQLTRFDFSALTKTKQEQAFQTTSAKLQTSLNLSAGPLVRFAVYDFGVNQPRHLLLIIHHLAVDMISWRILLEDLQTVYQQLKEGKKIQLPAKTTSFKSWSQHLHEYAQSVVLQKEWDYWLTKLQKQITPLPVDFIDGENTVASERNVTISLGIEQTQALLQEVPQAYNTQINDVLLTALVEAFSQWTGANFLLVGLESHGREEIFDDLDLSRTIGWFTSICPLLLDLGKSSHPGEALKTIKEQLRSIPNRGIGYSIRRYLNNNIDKVAQLASLPQPEVIFNYSGQFDQTFSTSSLFKFLQNSSGLMSSPRNTRSELIEINGLVFRGQLRFDLAYSENIHRQSTIERLAQELIKALQVLINHCQSSKVKSYTPSDFPELVLNQKDLDKFLTKLTRRGK